MYISDIYDRDIFSHQLSAKVSFSYNGLFNNGFDMKMHRHGRMEIMYLSKGRCSIYSECETMTLNPGDFVFINGNTGHRLFMDKNISSRVLCLEFTLHKEPSGIINFGRMQADLEDSKLFVAAGISILRLKDTNNLYNTLFDIYREANSSGRNSGYLIDALFSIVFLKIFRIYSQTLHHSEIQTLNMIKRSCGFIENNYTGNIGAKEIAARVGLHPDYFGRLFKQHMGLSPLAYLNNIRFEHAKYLLRYTSLTVEDVCVQSGFHSRQYFTNSFRQKYGISPLAYRKNAETSSADALL